MLTEKTKPVYKQSEISHYSVIMLKLVRDFESSNLVII